MAELSRTQRLQARAVSPPGACEERVADGEIAREIRPRAARGVEHTSLAESLSLSADTTTKTISNHAFFAFHARS